MPRRTDNVAHETTQHEPCLFSIALSRDSIASSLSRSGLAATVSSAAICLGGGSLRGRRRLGRLLRLGVGIDSLDEVLVGGHKELQVPFSLVLDIN